MFESVKSKMAQGVLSAEIQTKLAFIAAQIREVIPDATVYLFGSYARGEETADSDLDICVLTADKSKRCLDWCFEARMKLFGNVDMPMDLLVRYEDEFRERSKSKVTFDYIIAQDGICISAA